tara:strand:+ start:623 stop:835 length:213 start_codon:yes stop_codon:yes gene_type:complete
MSNMHKERMEQRLLELQERVAMTKRDMEEISRAHEEEKETVELKLDKRRVDISIMNGIVDYLDKEIKKNE